MYKVFIYDKPIFFTENAKSFQGLEGVNVINFNEIKSLKAELENLAQEDSINTVVVHCANSELAWSNFQNEYKYVAAAGGVVLNNGKILVMNRNGKWDLPKGKIEKGEEISEGALREVEEECGISAPELQGESFSTYHTYDTYGEDCFKRTYWFKMSYSGTERLIPQTEEGITEVKWIEPNDLAEVLENTYESIRDVFRNFEFL